MAQGRLLGLVAVVAAGVVMVSGPVGAGDKGPKPVGTVCHEDGDGRIRPLELPQPALDAHVAHGDGVPGDPIPGVAGAVFGEDCEAVFVVVDTDGDTVPDPEDNCPAVPNAGQEDTYGSGAGDACEDTDGDGTPDVAEVDVCVSANGTALLDNGSASCRSAAGSFAYAEGSGAEAVADGGAGNVAEAIGTGASAMAALGDDNVARATGESSGAFAGAGDRNRAIAEGVSASATAVYGDENRATATGDGTSAYAGAATGCTSEATASDPDVSCV